MSLSKTQIEDSPFLEGTFHLLPIQAWFFTLDLMEPSYWNQSFMVKVPQLDTNKLSLAVVELNKFHDILRLRFNVNLSQPLETTQKYLSPTDSPSPKLKILDIRLLNEQEGSPAYKRKLSEMLCSWQNYFNLKTGPLYSISYLHGFEDGSARIYFALHHIIVDSVSWSILMEDLEDLYNGLEIGEKGTSYRDWVYTVKKYGENNQTQKLYWENIMRDFKVLKLSVNSIKSIPITSRFTINHQIARTILQECKKLFATEINDILLTALGFALSKFSGDSVNFVTLEGHGRPNIEADKIDLSRTVGWFTSMYPMRLQTLVNDIPGSIDIIRKARMELPEKGFGYGPLFGYDMSKMPQIIFNYIGQSYTNPEPGSWSIVQDEHFYLEESVSQKNAMYNVLSINGVAVREGFQFTFTCPFDFGQRIGEDFCTALEAISNYTMAKLDL